jgi:hypothetical protein
MLGVVRAIWGYLAVTTAIVFVAAIANAAGMISVPVVYGVCVLAGLITMVGYYRWDLEHFPETPEEAERRRRRRWLR